MLKRRYIIHYTFTGIAAVLTIYAASCQPLPFSEIVQLVQLNVNPACQVKSYEIEVPELPQSNASLLTINISYTASGTAAGPTYTSIRVNDVKSL